MVDGSESGPPSNLGRAGSGRYALIDSTGIGLPCVNCEYEIRARGFQPYRFRAGDYCVSVPHDGYCSMVEVQATLIREDTAAEEEPVDTTGWRISCEQALIDAKWKLAKLVPAFRHARVDERHLQPVTYIPDGPRKLPRIDTWIDFGLSLNTQGHREAYSALIFSGTGTFSFDWEPYELEECANDKICDDREERKAAPGVSTFLSSSPRYREQFTAIFKPALDRCVEMGRTRQQTETHLLDDKRREKAVDACLPGESYPEGTQVKLSWEVGLDGRVRFTEVEISGAAAEEIRRVEDCLQAKAKHWRMPKPRDGMPQTDGFVTTYE